MFQSLNRRQFVNFSAGAAAGIGFFQHVPSVFAETAREVDNQEKILVVVQLSGGNDGLNTVVPFADELYYKNRFTLAIGKNAARKINDEVSFHPSLDGFAKLIESNQLSVIQGVGYPNPNRSHFESMDLWHTAHQTDARIPEGWLGKLLTSNKTGADQIPAIHFGQEKQPLALASATKAFPSIRSIERFRLNAARDRELKKLIESNVAQQRETGNELLDFVQTTADSAIKAGDRVEEVLKKKKSTANYPGSRLAEKLKTIARMIHAEMPTTVYYVTHDGFDTHANQAEAHAGLLSQLGDAVNAFMEDLTEQGNEKRVLLMSFSEFGRRVRQNASQGTDHGTAGPMFLAGGAVKSGVIGKHPRLDDLDQGDLKFHTDYRQVYATILEKWFGVSGNKILGGKYKPLELFG